jgi:hypothetical protein
MTDIDMDAENMAIATGGWCKVGHSLRHAGTDLLLATALQSDGVRLPPLKPDSSDTADDDVCELDELKIPMTPITNKRLKLLIENKMGGTLVVSATGLLLIVLPEDIELPKRERFRGRAKGKQVASGAPECVESCASLGTR